MSLELLTTRLPRMLRAVSRRFSTAADSSLPKYTFALDANSFEMHKCASPETTSTHDKNSLLAMYRSMVVIRRLETACDALYKAKLIRGFCHLSTGQEAVAVGMEAAISKEDAIITAYRCHGYAYGRGTPASEIIAELLGKSGGSSKGKGGSMHIFGQEFYGGNGIVGAQVPIGAGIALAQQYRASKNVTFSLYGDGAANQGQVFEAYNMSKLWSLPAVFVCENNKYGMGTSDKRAAACTTYYTRGDYIPGVRVNGMDVLAIFEACRYAREYALKGNGPMLLEMMTYRYGGHSMSDPGTTYRTREEIQQMRSHSDCIVRMRGMILEQAVATEDELKAIDKSCKQEIDEAVKIAKESPDPAVGQLYEDIFVKGTEIPWIRGCASDEGRRFAQ